MPLPFDKQQHAMQGAAVSLISSNKELLQQPLHDTQKQEQHTRSHAEMQIKSTDYTLSHRKPL